MSQNPPKSQMAQSQLGQSCCWALPTENYGARRRSEGCIADRWRRWMKQFFVRHPSESELATTCHRSEMACLNSAMTDEALDVVDDLLYGKQTCDYCRYRYTCQPTHCCSANVTCGAQHPLVELITGSRKRVHHLSQSLAGESHTHRLGKLDI